MNDTLGPEYYNNPGSGLVGYWRFDEGMDTTAFDLTGNHNDGIIHGATYVPSGAILAIQSPENNLPLSHRLYQNYPNPFNPTTRIQYGISSRQFVSVKVYDILGNELATLVNEEKSAGQYDVEFDGANLASGVYFYRLQAENFQQTRKMLLMK
jgi:hypothetical protein